MPEPKTTEDLLADAQKALTEHDEAAARHTNEAAKLRALIVMLGGVALSPPWWLQTLPATLPWDTAPLCPPIYPTGFPIWPLPQPFGEIICGTGFKVDCACLDYTTFNGGPLLVTNNTIEYRGVQKFS